MSLSITIPSIGEDFPSAAAAVDNNFTNLSAWANGAIPGTDLSPTAAILRSQMAGGGGNVVYTSIGTNTSATDGHLYNCSAPLNLTLPTPTAGCTVGVFAGIGTGISGAAQVRVTAGGGNINGVGLSAAASFALGVEGAFALLQATGSAWILVSGQQDTGWVSLSLVNSWTASVGYYTPAYRLRGDTVSLRGKAHDGSAATVATLPSGVRPASQVDFTSSNTTVVTSAGVITNGFPGAGSVVQLDGVSFPTS